MNKSSYQKFIVKFNYSDKLSVNSPWLKTKNFSKFLFFVFILLNALSVFAGPGRTTYQAKIIKPDGYPLEAASVNFKFTILDPAGVCILYAETFSTVNMAATAGLISFSLGSGIKTYPASATTFEQAFSNITPSLSCDAGGPPSYSPLSDDARKIVMQFHDGNGWQTLPAMNINAVPYAMYANDAQKLGGVSATAFVQDADFPTCAGGQALFYNGTVFSCVAIGGTGVTSSTIATALGYTPADGASLTTITANISSVSSSIFSVSSTVSSLASSVSTLQSAIAVSFSTITSSQWVTSGTTISYVAGSVGIGTSSPQTLFHVSGSSASPLEVARFANVGASDNSYMVFQRPSDPTRGLVIGHQAVRPGQYSNAATIRASGGLSENIALIPGISTNQGVIELAAASAATVTNNYNSPMTRFIGSYYTASPQSDYFAIQNVIGTGTTPTATMQFTHVGASATAAYSFMNANVGIGTTSPTAKLHLDAGTSTLAALKFTSGTLLTAPQSGTIEYDGFDLYYTDGTSTRRTIATGSGVTSASIVTALGYTPANSATLTTLNATVTSLSSTVTVVSSTLASQVATVNSVSSTVATLSTFVTSLSNTVSGIAASSWSLAGNAGTSATVNFIGTTDNIDVVFRRNNYNSGLIGSDSTAFGKRAYSSASGTGTNNSAFGVLALLNNLSGSYNVAVGSYALTDNTTGQHNTAIGHEAGYNSATALQSNSNSVFIGDSANTSVNGLSNVIAIGYQARATQSNQVVIGNGAITHNQLSGGVDVIITDASSGIAVRNNTSVSSRYPIIQTINYGNGTTGHPVLGLQNSQGTSASPAALIAGQSVGTLLWTGQTSASQAQQVGRIDVVTEANLAPNAAPARMIFSLNGPTGTYTQRLVINQYGYLGVGAITPTAFLHLPAGTSSAASVKLTSGTLLASPQSGTIEYDGFNFYTTNGAGTRSTIATATDGKINLLDSSNTFGSGTNSVLTGSDSNGLVWHVGVSGTQALDINSRYSGGPITMTIGGSEMMRVVGSSGFVGIGTQAPTQKLDVHGYMRSASGTGGAGTDGGRLYFGLNYTGTTAYDMSYVGGYTQFAGNDGSGIGAAGGLVFATKPTTGATSSTERMRITHLGNVGIGTNNPQRKLHISSANNSDGLLLENGTTDSSNLIFHDTSQGVSGVTWNLDSANGALRIFTEPITALNPLTAIAGAERLVILPSGHLGIGTGTPLKGLHATSGSMIGSTDGFPAVYATVHNEFHSGVLKKWTETSGNHVNAGTYSLVAPTSASTKSSHSLVNILFTDVASGVTSTGSNNSFYTFAARNRYTGNTDNGHLNSLVGIRNEYGHENGVPANAPTTTQLYGALFGPKVMTGTVSNLYDIYISSPAGGGTIGQHYSIYQEASSATNVFNGRIGIGTASPDGSLHIATSVLQSNSPASGIFMGKSLGADYQIQLTQNSGTPHIDFARLSSRDYDARISSPANSTLSMGTASNSTLLNLFNSYVGIGTQTPTRALQIGTTGGWQDGSGILVKGSNPGIEFADTQGTVQRWLIANGVSVANDGNLGLAYNVNTSTHNIVVTSGGLVGIGTLTPDDKFMVFNGTTTGRYTTTGWTHISDARYKHDIKTLDNSLDKILKLRGVEYKFNSDPQNKNQVGFIAQEIEPIFPEVVVTDKKGFKSMVYSNLVAPLVEAVKSLYVELKENILETRQNTRVIASLQQENEKLKNENLQKSKELDDVKSRLDRIEKLLNSK